MTAVSRKMLVLLKYTAKAVAVALPFLLPALLGAKLLRLVPDAPAQWLLAHGVDAEQLLRGITSMAVLVVAFAGDALNLEIPHLEAKRFGAEYVTVAFNAFVDKALRPESLEAGRDLRVNVMFVRRAWWLLYASAHSSEGGPSGSSSHLFSLNLAMKAGASSFSAIVPQVAPLGAPSHVGQTRVLA